MRIPLLGLVALAGLAACGHSSPAPKHQLAVCVAPDATRAPGDPVTVEFRQGGDVIASGRIQVGGVFAAPVPGTPTIDAYADDVLVGTADTHGGDVYLHGDGCPAVIPSPPGVGGG
jgi:hypothetical protein